MISVGFVINPFSLLLYIHTLMPQELFWISSGSLKGGHATHIPNTDSQLILFKYVKEFEDTAEE